LSIYARVQGGLVIELFTPPMGTSISECFAPVLTWVDVTSVSPAPQPGWIGADTSGEWAFSAPVAPTLTVAQQAADALFAPYTITSPTIGITAVSFAVDAVSQSHMQAEMIALLTSSGSSFADGAASIDWPDTNGINHALNTTQAKALFMACGAYVSTLYKCINGTISAVPSNPATIS
jgi:hypothetical protein